MLLKKEKIEGRIRNAVSKIWSSLAQFGKQKLTAYLWNAGETPSSTPKQIELGKFDDLNDACGDHIAAIHRGASFFDGTKRTQSQICEGDLAKDIGFHFHPGGGDLAPSSRLTASNYWIESFGFEKVLNIIRTHFEQADRDSPSYGFVDYSNAGDTLWGAAFGSVMYLNIPFHRFVEQSLWQQHRSKSKKVRGVYWGNYLPNCMLASLGGDEFVERYTEFAVDGGNNPNAHIWKFANGAFLTVSLDPSIERTLYGGMNIQTINNTNWLVNEHARAELL